MEITSFPRNFHHNTLSSQRYSSPYITYNILNFLICCLAAEYTKQIFPFCQSSVSQFEFLIHLIRKFGVIMSTAAHPLI